MRNKQSKLSKPILLVMMGVSGCGKSTVANAIARSQNFIFLEADDFHSDHAKATMASGQALNNDMRKPWVEALSQQLQIYFDSGTSCVMAFSGLAKQHRDAIRSIPFEILFFHLHAPHEIIRKRTQLREHHFMPPSLLISQYDALQATSDENDVFEVCVESALEQIIEKVTAQFGQHFKTKPG